MSLPTPVWLTNSECTVEVRGSTKTLPADSYARVIDPYWLPDYIKEEIKNAGPYARFQPSVEVYCYTHWGIVRLLWYNLRKV